MGEEGVNEVWQVINYSEKKKNNGCFSMRHMALLVFGVIFVSKDDNGYRWQKKQKKTCTWRGVHVLLFFYHWLLPYAFYRSYFCVLLVAESKENIFGEYVDFRVEIIVENYRIFLVVSILVGVPLYIFFNYLIIEYSVWR